MIELTLIILTSYIYDGKLGKRRMPFGKTSYFKMVKEKILMIRAWEKHHKTAKYYDR